MNIGNLFNLSGRIGRAEIWLRAVAYSVAFFLVLLIAAATGSDGLTMLITIIGYVALFLLSLSANFKRWHDRGKSGKWVLIGLIPIIGGIWSFIELGFVPGTDGPNEYGQPGSGSAKPEPVAEPHVLPSRYS